jgi:hypothetical protein
VGSHAAQDSAEGSTSQKIVWARGSDGEARQRWRPKGLAFPKTLNIASEERMRAEVVERDQGGATTTTTGRG